MAWEQPTIDYPILETLEFWVSIPMKCSGSGLPRSLAGQANSNTGNRTWSAVTVCDVSVSGDAKILESWLPRAGAWMSLIERQVLDLDIYSFV